jgi:uncharacterized protein (TIGR03905 family)
MKTTYSTFGTCARFIDIELDGPIVQEVRFIGGCAGNTRAVANLVKGLPVTEVIAQLKGIACRGNTSCPDQLAQALQQLTLKQAG